MSMTNAEKLAWTGAALRDALEKTKEEIESAREFLGWIPNRLRIDLKFFSELLEENERKLHEHATT